MKTRQSDKGFSLVENVLSIALVSLLGLSLVGMMILSGKLTRLAREEIVAAEIIEARLEALRSCSWNQIKLSEFVPAKFAVTNGIIYSGSIKLSQPAVTETYNDELVAVSIEVNWDAGKLGRSMAMSSYISLYGFSAP